MSDLRIGGMALRDGVMMQSERFWTAAVRLPDGSLRVRSGRKIRLPGRRHLARVPVVRGVARVAESMSALPAVRREMELPVLPHEDPRILAVTLGSATATVALRRSGRGSPVFREFAAAALSLLPALLAIRDSELSRLHGAEHKSIAAYEGAGPAAEAEREHDRCGSNLIGPLVATNIAANLVLQRLGSERRPLRVLVAGLISIGSAVELFSWMAEHRGHPVADLLRLPGVELQRFVTTAEPSGDQLDVAQAALQELLRLEAVVVA